MASSDSKFEDLSDVHIDSLFDDVEALCRIRSNGAELITLGRKLHSGTFKTKELVPV